MSFKNQAFIKSKTPGPQVGKHVSFLVIVFLFVVVERVARGRALLTDVAGEDGHHMIGLYVAGHVVTPAQCYQTFLSP